MKIDFQPHPDYIVFAVTGKYNLTEAVDKFSLVFIACRYTGLGKVLIDYRHMEGGSSATLDILYAHHVVEMYQNHLTSGGTPIKVACLPGPK